MKALTLALFGLFLVSSTLATKQLDAAALTGIPLTAGGFPSTFGGALGGGFCGIPGFGSGFCGFPVVGGGFGCGIPLGGFASPFGFAATPVFATNFAQDSFTNAAAAQFQNQNTLAFSQLSGVPFGIWKHRPYY